MFSGAEFRGLMSAEHNRVGVTTGKKISLASKKKKKKEDVHPAAAETIVRIRGVGKKNAENSVKKEVLRTSVFTLLEAGNDIAKKPAVVATPLLPSTAAGSTGRKKKSSQKKISGSKRKTSVSVSNNTNNSRDDGTSSKTTSSSSRKKGSRKRKKSRRQAEWEATSQ